MSCVSLLGVKHDGSHIGKECEECGTKHRVLESLPARPFSRSALDSLREEDSVKFVRGVGWFFSGTADDDVETTEDIVLGTKNYARFLTLHETGWVVEQEDEIRENEDPEEYAFQRWQEVSQGASEAFHAAFD